MKKNSLLKNTSLLLMLVTVFLSILLILPITENFINDSKSYLLFFFALTTLFLFILKTFKEKSIKLIFSPISGALLFFGLVVASSTFFTSNYPVEGLLGMGGIYISTIIIAVLGGSLIPKNSFNKFLVVIASSSAILVLSTLLQMVGFGPAQLINKIVGANLPTNMVLNLTGSPFIALQLILITITGVITNIITQKKINKIFAILLPILIIGIGLYTIALLPGKETSLHLPSSTTSWSIMLDSIKNPKAALIGNGPSSYSNVYSIFKPLWMNKGELWSVTYSQAANLPLTLIPTIGILGFISWLFFISKFISFRKKTSTKNKPLFYMILISLIFQLLLPVNTIIFIIQAIMIAFLIANEKDKLPTLQLQALNLKVLNPSNNLLNKSPKSTSFFLYLTSGILMTGILVLFYLTGRTLYASNLMLQASKSLSSNDLVKAYELQQKVVKLNPYLDSFRIKYASTNLATAIALSNKADINDEEKKQVSSLLQQAVREASAATTLDANDYRNWLALAQIYEKMIGITKDADQWVVQSYTSAINLSPNDPMIRLQLAGIFTKQKSYQQAANILSQSINIKPDFPGTYYNLAINLENLQSYSEARNAYQKTLALLDPSSEDYTTVNKKLETLEKLMKEKGISLEPKQQGQQQTPSITEQNIKNNTAKKSNNNEDVVLSSQNQKVAPEVTPSQEATSSPKLTKPTTSTTAPTTTTDLSNEL